MTTKITKQLIIVSGEIKGEVKICETDSLKDVRALILKEFDVEMLPYSSDGGFCFHVNDIRISHKQEEHKVAWDLLKKKSEPLQVVSLHSKTITSHKRKRFENGVEDAEENHKQRRYNGESIVGLSRDQQALDSATPSTPTRDSTMRRVASTGLGLSVRDVALAIVDQLRQVLSQHGNAVEENPCSTTSSEPEREARRPPVNVTPVASSKKECETDGDWVRFSQETHDIEITATSAVKLEQYDKPAPSTIVTPRALPTECLSNREGRTKGRYVHPFFKTTASASSSKGVGAKELLPPPPPPPTKNHAQMRKSESPAAAHAVKSEPSSKSEDTNPAAHSRFNVVVVVQPGYLGPTLKDWAKNRCRGDRVLSIDGIYIEPKNKSERAEIIAANCDFETVVTFWTKNKDIASLLPTCTEQVRSAIN